MSPLVAPSDEAAVPNWTNEWSLRQSLQIWSMAVLPLPIGGSHLRLTDPDVEATTWKEDKLYMSKLEEDYS